MNKKQLLSLTLATSLAFGGLPPAMAAESATHDLSGHWAATAMKKWNTYGVINGYADGSMRPNHPVTRAEFVSMLDRIMVYQESAPNVYADCADSDWYTTAILHAAAAGIIQGDGSRINPDAAATRQQAAVIMARVLELDLSDTGMSGFADDAAIADFARPSVKALRAAGVIKGDDTNRFQPNQTITRGEIAQLLSNAFDVIIPSGTSLNETSVGSVVLQGDGASLNGQHIKGDVIIAEGVADGVVTLNNVIVDGRILVRGGGANSVHLNKTKASHVLVDKNGSPVTLNIASDSAVEQVTVSDGTSHVKVLGNANTLSVIGAGASLELGGTISTVKLADSAKNAVIQTASIAKISKVIADAPGAVISGSGKVAHVTANADNIKVSTTGTTVTAAKGTTGVTAGGKPVSGGQSSAAASTSSSGSSSGSSSAGSTQATLINAAQTKLVDLGWSRYVTVSFSDGYSLSNSTLTIDGVDVTSAFSKVDDSGKVAKWELTSLNPAKLVVSSGSRNQTVTLSSNPSPTAPVLKDKPTAPAYIMTHGAVSVWDYHLTNFDNAGNVRVRPSKTTFSLDAISSATVKSYSPAAELRATEANNYGVAGEVEILFNYNTAEEKAWFDAIAETDGLALVEYNENKNTLNGDLEYVKETVPHHGGTVGKLTIPIPQSNFYTNKRYYVRVQNTQGVTVTLVPIHVVNETAPSMKLSASGAIRPGQNVHFDVENMVYGITQPIETVTLTDPTGQTKTLEKITDWYLIGNLFVLYNNTNNNTLLNGDYTVTAYSNGFKPMSKTFTVTDGEAVLTRTKRAAVDAMTRATSSAGSGSGSGDSGSSVMPANLLFNVDLLVNALLLEELGIVNQAAEGIATRWHEEVSGWDYVFSESGEIFYEWVDYFDAVQSAALTGQYLSFADYAGSGNAQTTANRPYAVKEILEDNLLGETQYNGSYKGMTPPTLKLEADTDAVAESADAVIVSADDNFPAYLSAISAIYVNGNWQALSADKYSVSGGKLTIRNEALTLGDNSIELVATGYRSNTMRIRCQKALEENAEMLTLDQPSGYQIGDTVIVTTAGATGDYFKYLTAEAAVKLTLPDDTERIIRPDGQESVYNKVGYTVAGRTLTLGKDLFTTPGEYTLTLTPQYYGEKQLRFSFAASVTTPDPDVSESQTPPMPVGSTTIFGGDYSITFGMGNSAWINAISGVTVNGQDYASGMVWNNKCYSTMSTDGILSLGSEAFQVENNHILITAAGYADLSVTLTKSGALVTNAESNDSINEAYAALPAS